MTIQLEDFAQFIAAIEALTMKGLGFKAYGETLTIELTGAY